ncbi:cytochrome P450 [Colletotrichum cuscutae]|uniref:Cytochrome P450 n=1 Tax=Colletotrichum cuscutae TaxID=1209917 RepID=A0AAI9XYS0_9PEZI|nr:cytochrome P450 [Colletotrichum cuscutae]
MDTFHITFERVVHRPYTLSSGFTIPAHTTIGIPTQAITIDEFFYPDPETFDAFRFARMREERSDMDGRAQYVASNPTSLRRFFAAHEIKAIMAHLGARKVYERKHNIYRTHGRLCTEWNRLIVSTLHSRRAQPKADLFLREQAPTLDFLTARCDNKSQPLTISIGTFPTATDMARNLLTTCTRPCLLSYRVALWMCCRVQRLETALVIRQSGRLDNFYNASRRPVQFQDLLHVTLVCLSFCECIWDRGIQSDLQFE